MRKAARHPYLPHGWWHQHLKLSHLQHTAKVLPHHHTSYGLLLLILLLIGCLMVVLPTVVVAGPPQTESGSVTVTGVVPGAPPSTPAVIVQPTNGQTLTITPTTVRGTCPDDTVVEIFRNNVFAGSDICVNNGFERQVSLTVGSNKLVAKVRDSLNQYGPDSSAVTVTYQPAAADEIAPEPEGPPFVLSADSLYKGIIKGQELTLNLKMVGGQPPYAIVVSWGDGKDDIVSQPAAGELKLRHSYDAGAIYTIVIRGSDQAGGRAYLEIAVLVAGEVLGTIQTTPLSSFVPSQLYLIWPLYVSSVLMISTFWLGERYMFYRLSKVGLSHLVRPKNM